MNFDRFVGLPYVDKGRSFAGVDCWGLAWLVCREIRGVEMPSFHDRYTLPADRKIVANLIAGDGLSHFDDIAAGAEIALDCVLMREAGLIRHVGIVTRPGRLLHIQRGETSRVESYRAGMLRPRVAGFYRYRDQ